MQFRSLTVADAELLFHWKNDPVTRVNSSSTAEIPWEEHFKWVLSVILDPNEEIIRMAIFDQVPVGIVRIALRDDEQVEVYYTVSPVWRRQGIGTKMVVDFVAKFIPDMMKVVLPIKQGNIGSERIAYSLGLCKLLNSAHETEAGQPPIIEWVRPTAGDA